MKKLKLFYINNRDFILLFLTSSILILMLIDVILYFLAGFPINKLTENISITKDFIYIFGGFTAAIIAIWRLSIADKNRKIEQKKELHSRYGNAIELLSNQKESIRIGALYTLKQLAIENKETFNPCLEILTNYIRNELSKRNTNNETLNEDIRICINLVSELARLLPEWKLIDLQSVNLSKLDLSHTNINFNKIDFSFANFERTKFRKKINLATCKFKKANLSFTRLSRAVLKGAYLVSADLSEAYLRNAFLQNTNLAGAIFSKACLQSTRLQGAIINSTDFRNADLRDVYFSNNNIRHTKFSGVLCDQKLYEILNSDRYKFINLNKYSNKEYLREINSLYIIDRNDYKNLYIAEQIMNF